MTFAEFDEFQAALIAEVVKIKDTKGKEYANSESRFANFDRLSAKLGISRIQVCNVYMTKHLDAIDSYCKNGTYYSNENIRGRIVDAITYLTLLAGMIAESEATAPEKPLDICKSCQCIKSACLCTPDDLSKNCSACGGIGRVYRNPNQDEPQGQLIGKTCPACKGTGKKGGY